MPKKRRYIEPVEPPIAMGAQGPAIHGTVLDGHLPLPGPVRQVKNQRPTRAANAQGRERYELYLRALRNNFGDPVAALCEVTGQTPAAIVDYGVARLHGEIVKGADIDRPMDRLLPEYDLTQPALMGVLRKHLFGDHPAASLKAADILREMLGNAREGETIEDLIRDALGEAG